MSASAAEIKISFGGFTAGQSPTNFSGVLAGGGLPGEWRIVLDDTPSLLTPMTSLAVRTSAAKRAVLAQLSGDPMDERFPMFIYSGETFKNFKTTVPFKIVSGSAEQMAGVVFRYQNPSNFYVFRASALGRNVRFYKVVDGARANPIGPGMDITTNTWHTLAVQCQGAQITCWFDGKLAMPMLNDISFSSGKIGFWTKSDAVTYFGDATIDYTPIVSPAQSLVSDILKQSPRILGLRIYTPDDTGEPRVLASKVESEVGMAGTDAEKGALTGGKLFYGHGTGTVVVTMPLNDRNGDAIAAVRVELKSNSLAETQDMVLTRVRAIVNEMQKRVLSKSDLMQ